MKKSQYSEYIAVGYGSFVGDGIAVDAATMLRAGGCSMLVLDIADVLLLWSSGLERVAAKDTGCEI